jgi:hypothetical protein
MSITLRVNGRLWGLVACHHYVPRFVHFEIRAVAELLAEAIGTRIAALESFAQAQAELSVRRLEQRMIAGISRDGDWRRALFDGSAALLQPLAATGAALVFEDEILTVGEVPGTPQLRQIAAWLDEDPPRPILATAQLGLDAPQFAPLTAIASGLLAAAISNQPGEYIVWFRPERVRTVTWGGDPSKPMVIGDDPADLSPRRSFAQWHQVVEGKSDPWTPADRTTATLIGETVTDVVIQFRSVRMLIVENQLEQVRRQVQRSEQPVLVAEAGGRILHANDAFRHLLPPGRQTLRRLDDLPGLFTDPAEAGGGCALTHDRRSWRGRRRWPRRRRARPILVRADPVWRRAGAGLVVLLTDLVEPGRTPPGGTSRRASSPAIAAWRAGRFAGRPALSQPAGDGGRERPDGRPRHHRRRRGGAHAGNAGKRPHLGRAHRGPAGASSGTPRGRRVRSG